MAVVRAIIAVILVVVGQPAWADSGSLAVVVAAHELRPLVQVNAAAGARRAGAAVRPVDTSDGRFSAAIVVECLEQRALCQEAVAAAGANQLLVLRAEGKLGDNQLVISAWLLNGETGKVIETDRRFCAPPCKSRERMARLVEALAHSLVAKDQARQAPETWVQVYSSPDHARVWLNGKQAGVSGRAFRIAPGPVEIRITKKGYTEQTRSVVVAPNNTLSIRVVLVPLEEGGTSNRTWAWGTLAAGLGTTALGVTQIALHRDGVANGGKEPDRYESLTPGIISVTLGAGLVVTSVILFVKGRKKGASFAVYGTRSPAGFGIGVSGEL